MEFFSNCTHNVELFIYYTIVLNCKPVRYSATANEKRRCEKILRKTAGQFRFIRTYEEGVDPVGR